MFNLKFKSGIVSILRSSGSVVKELLREFNELPSKHEKKIDNFGEQLFNGTDIWFSIEFSLNIKVLLYFLQPKVYFEILRTYKFGIFFSGCFSTF